MPIITSYWKDPADLQWGDANQIMPIIYLDYGVIKSGTIFYHHAMQLATVQAYPELGLVSHMVCRWPTAGITKYIELKSLEDLPKVSATDGN